MCRQRTIGLPALTSAAGQLLSDAETAEDQIEDVIIRGGGPRHTCNYCKRNAIYAALKRRSFTALYAFC
jgi:hypothetical protein